MGVATESAMLNQLKKAQGETNQRLDQLLAAQARTNQLLEHLAELLVAQHAAATLPR